MQAGAATGRGPKQKGSCSPELSDNEEDTWAARLLKPLPVRGECGHIQQWQQTTAMAAHAVAVHLPFLVIYEGGIAEEDRPEQSTV